MSNTTMTKADSGKMSKDSLRSKRNSSLVNGKAKKIGFFESIPLKIAGCFDGRRGLPSQTREKTWTSPFMDREMNGYEEFCSQTWGTLQLENEEVYGRLGDLFDRICQARFSLKEAQEALDKARSTEERAAANRRKGEEKLTDDQVKARRASERAKRLVPLRSRVSSLENAMAADMEALSELCSRLAEEENTTRMICHRVKDHTLQRLDVYWNAALKRHPDKADMPVVPTVEDTCCAEQQSRKLHEDLIRKVELLRIQLADNKDGKDE